MHNCSIFCCKLNKPMNIIFDCDNTFDVPGCDVDDGLTLLYLLGSAEARLLGITTCYGNSDLATVGQTTGRMLRDLGREDIPYYQGCAQAGEKSSAAVDFLVQTARRHAGDISVLATGSLTNLWAAGRQDAAFLNNINEVVLMGGITQPLLIKGKRLDELNFSCDPAATLEVLAKAPRLAIATGNNCLSAFISYAEHQSRLNASASPLARYIERKTEYWFRHMRGWGVDGAYVWDIVAAAYLLRKDLFLPARIPITPDKDSLTQGMLLGGGPMINADLPQILDSGAFAGHIYQTMLAAAVNIN